MKAVNMLAMVLVVVGGVNWGLVGLLDMNLVSMLVGTMPSVENLVYILVGASALYVGFTHLR